MAGCCEHGNEFLDSIKGGKNDLEIKEILALQEDCAVLCGVSESHFVFA